MKKLLLPLLCVLLLAGCAEVYDGPTTTESVLSEYHVSHIVYGETQTSRSVYAYDLNGNLAACQEYDDGELYEVTYYRYDDRGNRISETHWDYTGLIPLPDSRTESTYDAQNRVLTRVYKNGWGLEEGRSTWVYDDEAHTTVWENSSGDRVVYYRDENGQELRNVSTGADGTFETVYEYDSQGYRISWTATENGEYWGCWKAGYDDQGRQIWFEHYDETNTRTTHVTYTYDDERNTKTAHDSDGTTRTEYRDTNGEVYLIEDHGADGELRMYQQYFYREILVPVT